MYLYIYAILDILHCYFTDTDTPEAVVIYVPAENLTAEEVYEESIGKDLRTIEIIYDEIIFVSDMNLQYFNYFPT